MSDAAFDAERGVAGIGVGYHQGPAFTCEAIPAADINEAEALAVVRGLLAMSARRFKAGSVIVCDNLSVIRMIEQGVDVGSQIRQLASDGGYRVERRPRKEVKAADRAAGEALRLWRAGLVREPTWEPVLLGR